MQVFSKLRFFGRKASSSEAPVVAPQQEQEAIDYFTLDHTHHDEVVVSGKNPAFFPSYYSCSSLSKPFDSEMRAAMGRVELTSMKTRYRA